MALGGVAGYWLLYIMDLRPLIALLVRSRRRRCLVPSLFVVPSLFFRSALMIVEWVMIPTRCTIPAPSILQEIYTVCLVWALRKELDH